MKLFSHNTMTYRTPIQWWLRPFFWMARCQCRNFQEQYRNGARYFDLRIRFNKRGDIEFGHGPFRYRADDIYTLMLWLKTNAEGVRITLEHCNGSADRYLFIEWCKTFEKFGIKIFGGYSRSDNWAQIYKCQLEVPPFLHCYASQTGWKIDDVFPFIYAYFKNRSILWKYKDTDELVMMDFI